MKKQPDEHGYFGDFGGRFVPETLMVPFERVGGHVDKGRQGPQFPKPTERVAGPLRRSPDAPLSGEAIGRNAWRCTDLV